VLPTLALQFGKFGQTDAEAGPPAKTSDLAAP
jgi:hypothetical protein